MSAAKELTRQIIALDANIVVANKIDPLRLIKKYAGKIGPEILWQLVITDHYQNKYTLRAYYYNCDRKQALKIHQRCWG
ncbi:MAG: hypothetical protein ABH807_01735 [Candidatus Shapirobacteria bacterium]